MKNKEVSAPIKKDGGYLALLPILVFIVLYLGQGIIFEYV